MTAASIQFERRGPGGRAPAGALLLSVAASWCFAAPQAAAALAVPGAAAQEEAPLTLPLVLAIRVEGHEAYSENQILGALGQAVGEPLDAERLRRGVLTLWESFRVIADVEQRAVTGGIELRVLVEEEQLDFAPRFVGNERVPLEKLLEWSGLENESELYLFQAPAVARRMLDEYRRAGYHFVTVEPVVREGNAEGLAPDVIFEINEGPKVRVSDVVIEGNEALPDKGWWLWREGLRRDARPELRGPRIGKLFAKAFDEAELERDVVAYATAFRDAGYLDVVVRVEELQFSDDRRWVTVRLIVDQGLRYTVDSLRIEGFEPPAGGVGAELPAELLISEAELLKEMNLQPGDPLVKLDMIRDRLLLRNRYGELGHIDHPTIPAAERFRVLDAQITVDPETAKASVLYRVSQGRPQRIRDVRFAGNGRTQDRVLRRQLSVFPGDMADLTEINRSLQRINGLRYFSASALRTDHREPSYRFVDTGELGVKDLEYVVEEGESIRFDFGVQLGSDNGFAGQIGVTFDNFDVTRWPSWNNPIEDIYRGNAWRGAGQTLRLYFAPGTDFSRFQVRFTEPDLFRDHIDRYSGTIDLNRRLRGFDTHDERRDEYAFRIGKQLDPDTTASVGLSVVDIQVDDLFVGGEPSLFSPGTVPNLLVQQEGESQLTGLSFLLRQRRLDTPIASREGYTWTAGTTLFNELLGGDYNYVEFELYGEYYRWLDPEEKRGGNLRLRGQATAGLPYGDTNDVPYTERSFLGGSRWMRGWDFRGVGPNQEGFAIGGQTMVAASADLLWPLVSQNRPGQVRQLDVFRAGVFSDAAVLDVDTFSLDTDELRVSVGFTLQMSVPIPIALNWGFALNADDDDETQTFSFAIAY